MKAIYKSKKVNGRRMDEHRFLMEQSLGRKLYGRREQVHHIDGDKRNNALSNLEVVSPKEHAIRHERWKHSPTKVCQVCGVVFVPHPTHRARAKTCSPACRCELTSRTNRRPAAPYSMYRVGAYPSQVADRKRASRRLQPK